MGSYDKGCPGIGCLHVKFKSFHRGHNCTMERRRIRPTPLVAQEHGGEISDCINVSIAAGVAFKFDIYRADINGDLASHAPNLAWQSYKLVNCRAIRFVQCN